MSMHVDVDVAVVGSGFAGALTALCLARRGQRVALVERGRHPRFAIGESSTPLANLLIEELADRYDFPRIRAFSKWGTWQRTHPTVACGLKRGFTFFFHEPGAEFPDDRDHARQLMVAASPHDDISDTHWYRPDFDWALVREAEAAGVIYLDDTSIDSLRHEGSRTVLDGTRTRANASAGGSAHAVHIAASFLIDASGPRGFLHRLLHLDERPLRWLPPTHGVYSHFEGVDRWDWLVRADDAPPYGPDDAALHHVFPGGWIWMLRFNNGITSAGAALTDPMAASLRGPLVVAAAATGASAGTDANAMWERLLAMLPAVQRQFREARAVLPFVHAPRLAFRSGQVCGDRWALLPSAVGVIDPLLSTGFPLTLLGITRLLDLLERTAADTPERADALRAYAQVTQDELDVTEQLVAALYKTMSDPLLFKRLALLYFAAASFSETARRLGRPELAPGFLLHAHPRFGPEVRACAMTVLGGGHAVDARTRETLLARIDRAIEPFDAAGLLDRSRRDWYPVLADDLVAGAAKFEATIDDVNRLLERCGLVARAMGTRA